MCDSKRSICARGLTVPLVPFLGLKELRLIPPLANRLPYISQSRVSSNNPQLLFSQVFFGHPIGPHSFTFNSQTVLGKYFVSPF